MPGFERLTTTLDPDDPLGPAVREPIAAELTGYLSRLRAELAGIGADVAELAGLAEPLLAGGKRFRPAFLLWSFLAAGGAATDLGEVVAPAASLELLHAGILVHDDVLDEAATRRGIATAHRAMAVRHRADGRAGDPDAFGRDGAILLGDLLQLGSQDLALRTRLAADRVAAATQVLERMRVEVTVGQYLDLRAGTEPLPRQTGRADELDRALAAAARVVEFKSARYTVVRPCQAGAAFAGAGPVVLDGLARFGSPVGRAFQYRDDLLGVFGDPAVTGKPAGDDLREGKRTVLIAHAWAGTDRAGRAELASLLGAADLDAKGMDRLREVIERSGARAKVEQTIVRLAAEADAALATLPLATPAAAALRRLAELAVQRAA